MAKKTQPVPKNFEDALLELEQILSQMESGEVGLEDSLIKFERGSFLINHCRTVLNSAEQQIQQITQRADGTLQTTPFDQKQAVEPGSD